MTLQEMSEFKYLYHKSIPAYGNFFWGMKFPHIETKCMSYSKYSSGYGKHFMAEQS